MIPALIIVAGVAVALWKINGNLTVKAAPAQSGPMSVVVRKKKHRRPVRAAFAKGAKIVKVKPLTADELARLTEKMCREKDPVKARKIEDQIVSGFYGEKLTPV